MLKLSDLKIDVKATVGSPLVLCRTNPTVEYAEGVRTSRRTMSVAMKDIPTTLFFSIFSMFLMFFI